MNTRAQQANTKTCAIALFSYGRSAQICFADKATWLFQVSTHHSPASLNRSGNANCFTVI